MASIRFSALLALEAKYTERQRCRPPSQGWRAFLRNHLPDMAAMDFFVVPTLRLLYALVIVRLDRRLLVGSNVSELPTAGWVARQITEAFPWAQAPRYLIRDRDSIYGDQVKRRLRAMGIRDKPTAPRSPLVERLCRTFNRLDPPRVSRSLHRRRRGGPPPGPVVLFALMTCAAKLIVKVKR